MKHLKSTKWALIIGIILMTVYAYAQDEAGQSERILVKDWGKISQVSGGFLITANEMFTTKKVGWQTDFLQGGAEVRGYKQLVTPEAQKLFMQLWAIENCFGFRYNSYQILMTKVPSDSKPWPKDVHQQIDGLISAWWKSVSK